MDLQERFAQFSGQYLDFHNIENPPFQRADLCAFVKLAQLIPIGSGGIISSADHDEIHLDANLEEFDKIATNEDILYLVRCGVECTRWALRMNV